MRKNILFMVPLFVALETASQDYIVTWKQDTIACQLPSDPRKAGFRPASKFRQGYFRVAAVFPNDSVRVFEAGQIRGYYRKMHGKGLLCDGHFEALQLEEAAGDLVTADERKTFQWAFLLRVEEGKYASLYKLMQWESRLYTYYYVVKKEGGKAGFAQLISGLRRNRELLYDADIREEMEKAVSKKTGLKELVAIYNRLKEKAAANTP